MDVAEFQSKIRPGIKLSIANSEYLVKEVVKFRFDDGSFYIKCFLNDGYVLADDLNENSFILVREVKTEFQLPFPKRINFDGKDFEFIYNAHAIAEEIGGEEIFKKGDAERFWDFKADDGSYLSLGINDQTNRRADDYGKIISVDEIEFK
jgi:hypothetical protein